MAQFEEVVTTEGDMVDAIAFRRFRTSGVVTEAIYEANPGLSEQGPILPVGLTIRIPLPEDKPKKTAQRLWD